MSFTAQDYGFMARAIELAKRGRYTTTPNPNVGCVLVKQGRIVGEGYHQRTGGAHAEVQALRMAAEQARGATAYVTLEPCAHQGRTPPCSQALITAGVAQVIAALEDPNPLVAGQGLRDLSAAGMQTASGLLAEQATQLNVGFLSRMQRQRPYVRVKMAASLDARTAMASGESQWITGAAARADVHRLRAMSSAIITGIGTVLADNPALTVRHRPSDYEGDIRQPIRVICDSQLQIPLQARVLATPEQTWVMTCHAASHEKKHALEAQGVRVTVFEGERLPLASVLQHLAQEQINEVMVEAGPTLAGAFVAANLVDEFWLYLAPHLMGDGARGLFHLPGIHAMDQRMGLQIKDVRQVGADIRFRAVRQEA